MMELTILYNLAIQPFSCPKELKYIKFNEEQFENFLFHTIVHKMQSFLAHLITCKYCKNAFNKEQLEKLKSVHKQKQFTTKLIKSKIKSIDKLLSKNKIKSILYKDLGWLPTYKTTELFQTWSDIDILLSYDKRGDLKKTLKSNGWKVNKKFEEFSRLFDSYWEEVVYEKSGKINLNLDVQFSAGKTHKNLYCLLKNTSLEKPVESALKSQKEKGSKVPPKHVQFSLLILHFYFHDQNFGLRQAFEIKEFAKTLDKNSWKRVIKFLDKSGFEKVLWFELLILESVFNKKLVPDIYKNKIDLKSYLSAKLYPFKTLQYAVKRTGLRVLLNRAWANLLSGFALT